MKRLFLSTWIAFAVLVAPTLSWAALTVVQIAVSADAQTNSPMTATFGSAVTAGHMIAVMYGIQNQNHSNTGQVVVTDSLGNGPGGNYVQVRADEGPGNFGTLVWAGIHYANNIAGGSDVVSMWSNGVGVLDTFGSGWTIAAEISGQDATTAIDTSGATANGNSTSPSVGLTTSYANSMILAVIQQSFFGSGESVGVGFTLLNDFTSSSGLGEYAVVGSAGAQTASGTLGAGNDWLASAIAIKAAGGAPPAAPAIFFSSSN